MNEKVKSFFSARNIATYAILIALVVVLQLFASAVVIGPLTLNFSLIPIVLAGIFFGWLGGGFLGLISGLITFITCAIMGREPSTLYLFQANPVLLTITCIGKTTVAGALAGLFYNLIAKKNRIVAAYVSAVSVAVINTGLYLLGMVLMKSDVATFLGLDSTSAGFIFITVFTLIWLNLVLEVAVNVVVAPAIASVAKVLDKKFKR